MENYSAGTRQKLLISQALAVEPRLLLLDEPLVSIDPLVGRKFKMYLKEVARRGTAVLFATHILTLAQEICRRIGIIVDGRIIVQGEPGRADVPGRAEQPGGILFPDRAATMKSLLKLKFLQLRNSLARGEKKKFILFSCLGRLLHAGARLFLQQDIRLPGSRCRNSPTYSRCSWPRSC